MRVLLALCLLGVTLPAHAAVWDETTIGGIIDDVRAVKDKVLTGDIPETAEDLRRQLDDLRDNGALIKDVAPKILRLLQERRQPMRDFAGPTFDCDAGTPCADFRVRLRAFGTDFASLADRLPMLAKAGVGDGSRFVAIVDRTPPFLLFFVHEALDAVPDWEFLPRDLGEIVDEVGDPDAFASDWRPQRARIAGAADVGAITRGAADTFCANKADRVTDPALDKVALNRWKAAITTTKLVVGAFAEFLPDQVGGAILGEGLSDIKIPIQAIVKAIASAVEVSGVLFDTFQANLEVCRARLAAVEQREREVEAHLASCTELNVYRTSGGNDEAYTRLSEVMLAAEAGGQDLTAALSTVRLIDNHRKRGNYGLAYRFMCKAYARIGDES